MRRAQISTVLSFQSDERVLEHIGVIGGHGGVSKALDGGEVGGERVASNEAMSFANLVQLGVGRKSPDWCIRAFRVLWVPVSGM